MLIMQNFSYSVDTRKVTITSDEIGFFNGNSIPPPLTSFVFSTFLSFLWTMWLLGNYSLLFTSIEKLVSDKAMKTNSVTLRSSKRLALRLKTTDSKITCLNINMLLRNTLYNFIQMIHKDYYGTKIIVMKFIYLHFVVLLVLSKYCR